MATWAALARRGRKVFMFMGISSSKTDNYLINLKGRERVGPF
jgi:hypothetical protein